MSRDDSRRDFIKKGSLAGLGIMTGRSALAEEIEIAGKRDTRDQIIDIHQHLFYHGRTDAELINHQNNMSVTHTILLPAGSPAFTMGTHFGHSNGLRAQCGVTSACYNFASNHPAYSFAANEVPDLPDAIKKIEEYLKKGGKMIAEVKFGLACDSPEMQQIYQLAEKYQVPVLMHWLFGELNYGFPRFYKMLEKYPKVKFIGHAQTWWANIDKEQQEHPWERYPKGAVKRGGLTDEYLSHYENLYGDLSAGSGLNALTRDPDFTKDFFKRHQDKLLFGSDCADSEGKGSACIGAQTIALIKKTAPKKIAEKLLYGNAKKLFNL